VQKPITRGIPRAIEVAQSQAGRVFYSFTGVPPLRQRQGLRSR
jgi:hypothetical protein